MKGFIRWPWAWPFKGAPHAIRGRVHRVSIIPRGEVSMVIRFGMDEPTARQVNQGSLVAVVTLQEKDFVPVKEKDAT